MCKYTFLQIIRKNKQLNRKIGRNIKVAIYKREFEWLYKGASEWFSQLTI